MSTDENRTVSQVVPTSDEYGRRDDGGDQWYPPYASDAESPHPADLLAAQREQYGGTKIGSAFFGWLVVGATALLLTALLAAAGAAIGAARGTTVAQATSWARADADTLGLVGAVTLAAVLFVAFGCGGYVAGRMARFDGARQGLAVWLWAVVLAVVVAGLGLGAGDRVDLPAGLDVGSILPVRWGDLSTAGLLAAAAVAAITLFGAILGGLAGMRFHRRVDGAGLR